MFKRLAIPVVVSFPPRPHIVHGLGQSVAGPWRLPRPKLRLRCLHRAVLGCLLLGVVAANMARAAERDFTGIRRGRRQS